MARGINVGLKIQSFKKKTNLSVGRLKPERHLAFHLHSEQTLSLF